eukprot:5737707-Amphidinium_carterae.1
MSSGSMIPHLFVCSHTFGMEDFGELQMEAPLCFKFADSQPPQVPGEISIARGVTLFRPLALRTT